MWTKRNTPAATWEFYICIRYQHVSTSKLDASVSRRTFEVLFSNRSLQLRAFVEWTTFSPLCTALWDKNVPKMFILDNSSVKLLKKRRDTIHENKNRTLLRSFLSWWVLFHHFFTVKLWQTENNLTTEPSTIKRSSGLSTSVLPRTAVFEASCLIYGWDMIA